jgi:hypothetical protein
MPQFQGDRTTLGIKSRYTMILMVEAIERAQKPTVFYCESSVTEFQLRILCITAVAT